tara:strand:+ start:45 stop:1232 length:1188 start_codon:yes stop_codon:yes gene_type:complete
MGNQQTAKPQTALAIIDSVRGELAPIAMDAGLDYSRLATAFNVACQQNPDILDCTPDSIRRELAKCAFDGLIPDAKEAVILPYKVDGKLTANYQPMVYGVMKRLRELGGVSTILCECVYETDKFEVDMDDLESLSHKANPFAKDRGEIIGAYVVFRGPDKLVMHREIMSRSALDDVRKASKSPGSPAWTKWFPEMCRKAVLRRGAKFITVNNDRIRAIIERQDAMYDFNDKRPEVERVDPFSGTTIDLKSSEADLAASSNAADERSETAPQKSGSQGSEAKADTSSEPASPFPERIHKKDMPSLIETLQKLVDMAAPSRDVDAADRRGILKASVPGWKANLSEYLHPLLKHVIDIVDKALVAQGKGGEWEKDIEISLDTVSENTGIDFDIPGGAK